MLVSPEGNPADWCKNQTLTHSQIQRQDREPDLSSHFQGFYFEEEVYKKMSQPMEVEQSRREPKRRKVEHQMNATAVVLKVCSIPLSRVRFNSGLLDVKDEIVPWDLSNPVEYTAVPKREKVSSKTSAARDVKLVIKEESLCMPCTRYTKDCVPVCKDKSSPEQKERGHRLIKKEPEYPQIKEELEELFQKQEDFQLEVDGTMLTLLTVKSEDVENKETVPPAITSSVHKQSQACAEDSDVYSDAQLLSSHCSESDTEDSDEWEETREAPSILNTLQSHKTHNVEGQRPSMSNKLFHSVKSSKQIPSMATHRGEKPFICTLCGTSFSLKCTLKRHMRIHTGEKPFSCNICGSSFSRRIHFKSHMRIHTGEKPFSCTVCGDSFCRASGLKQHMRVHTGEKPYICTVCGNHFGQMCYLERHMRIHTGEKPYSCTVCGSSFSQTSSLKKHMRIHTGEKPCSCTICGTSFSLSANLKRHMRIHTGEKPFSCTVCGSSFSQTSSLKQHMRIHTGEKPFSCTICGTSFILNEHLKRHMRIHTGEKPFSCTVCGNSFSQKGDLKIHMRIHTGEKPFSCTVCGNSFSQTQSLKKHMKVHTGGKP